MQTRGPRVIVQNTDSGSWLVSVTDFIGNPGSEEVSFACLVDRAEAPIPEIVRQATRRAIQLLQQSLDVT